VKDFAFEVVGSLVLFVVYLVMRDVVAAGWREHREVTVAILGCTAALIGYGAYVGLRGRPRDNALQSVAVFLAMLALVMVVTVVA
jgi:VIT1/CCC1 family predicted Fe2+/Mn2+ transporter